MQKIQCIREPGKSQKGFQFRQHRIQHWEKMFPRKNTQASIRKKSFQIWNPKFVGSEYRRPWESSSTRSLTFGKRSQETPMADKNLTQPPCNLASYSTNSSRQCGFCWNAKRTWFATWHPSTVDITHHIIGPSTRRWRLYRPVLLSRTLTSAAKTESHHTYRTIA